MNGPSRREDARNITLIAGGGLLGVLGTAALAAAFTEPLAAPTRHDVIRVRVEAPPPKPAPREAAPTEAGPFEATDRLYGHVETRVGAVHTGLIRWDRNEGSWSDVLDAMKAERRAGLRFGHIRAIEPTGRRSARITLGSGGVIELSTRGTDLGATLREVVVDDPESGPVRLEWGDLERVELEPAPPDLVPSEGRLHGTLTTRSGLRFTGHVAWSVTDIYTSDVLDVRDRTGARHIPFGSIASIQRHDSRGAVVVRTDGSSLTLRGGADIGSSNDGITVSDPGLGEVKVTWNELASVRFHPAETVAPAKDFDGGGPMRGTVITEGGDSHSGIVVWDRDEAASWEMLDGSDRGVEFQVEFGNIARVAKTDSGALVELRDGRTLHLTSSNDVTASNRGVLVGGGGSIVDVPWRRFAELRLDPGPP